MYVSNQSESNLKEYLTDWAQDTRHLTLDRVSHLECIISYRYICLKSEQEQSQQLLD